MTRADRVLRWAAIGTLILLLSTAAATAGRLGEKKAPARPDGQGDVFQLQSGLVGQIPAVRKALDAVRAQPSVPENWQALAKALSEAGDRDDAIRALEAAVEIAPERPDLWVDLGAVYVQSGEIDDAIDALDEALEIEPFAPLAHYNLGLAYQADGRYDDAMDAFEAALTLAPELGDPEVNPGVVNNPDMPMVKLRIYTKTTGAAPALFSGEVSEQEGQAGAPGAAR
jgi:tetratricopeptide (TPR) repeat protein